MSYSSLVTVSSNTLYISYSNFRFYQVSNYEFERHVDFLVGTRSTRSNVFKIVFEFQFLKWRILFSVTPALDFSNNGLTFKNNFGFMSACLKWPFQFGGSKITETKLHLRNKGSRKKMKLKFSAERERVRVLSIWSIGKSVVSFHERGEITEETENAMLDRIWFETFIHQSAGEFCA